MVETVNLERLAVAGTRVELGSLEITGLVKRFEFSGRNIGNRDKPISNEVKIYELRKLPVLDPAAIERKTLN